MDDLKDYLRVLRNHAEKEKERAEDTLEDVKNPVVNGSAVSNLSHKLTKAEGQLEVIREIEEFLEAGE